MKPRFFRDRASFRRWLEGHHASSTEQWVGLYKKGASRKGIAYEEAVEEGLCFGWIDGWMKSIDDERYMIRFTPRRATSNWSPTNIERFERLRAEGRIEEAGLEAWRRRRR